MLAKSLFALLALNAKLAAADECDTAAVTFFQTCLPFLSNFSVAPELSVLMANSEIFCTDQCSNLIASVCDPEVKYVIGNVCADSAEDKTPAYCDMMAEVETVCSADDGHDHGDEDDHVDEEEQLMKMCTTACGNKVTQFIDCASPFDGVAAEGYKSVRDSSCDECTIALADLYMVHCPELQDESGTPPLSLVCKSSCKSGLQTVSELCAYKAPDPADYPPGPNGTQPEIPENEWSWVLEIAPILAQCPADGETSVSPTPPPAPPISPAILSDDVEAKVKITLLLNMPLSACNAVFKADTCLAFAESSGVHPDNCNVECSEATRRRLTSGTNVDIALAVVNAAKAAAIRSKLVNTVLASSESASSLLGVEVLSTPVLDLAAPAPPPSPPSTPPPSESPPVKGDDSGLSTGAIVGIAVGAGLGGLVIVGLIAYCLKSSKSGGKQTYPAA